MLVHSLDSSRHSTTERHLRHSTTERHLRHSRHLTAIQDICTAARMHLGAPLQCAPTRLEGEIRGERAGERARESARVKEMGWGGGDQSGALKLKCACPRVGLALPLRLQQSESGILPLHGLPFLPLPLHLAHLQTITPFSKVMALAHLPNKVVKKGHF
jgi:hypothetical protein